MDPDHDHLLGPLGIHDHMTDDLKQMSPFPEPVDVTPSSPSSSSSSPTFTSTSTCASKVGANIDSDDNHDDSKTKIMVSGAVDLQVTKLKV